jgi:hypothetical protein
MSTSHTESSYGWDGQSWTPRKFGMGSVEVDKAHGYLERCILFLEIFLFQLLDVLLQVRCYIDAPPAPSLFSKIMTTMTTNDHHHTATLPHK